MTVRLVDADTVCAAAETTLRAHLPEVIALLGLDVNAGREKKYAPPAKWDQVPALEALASIPAFPAAVGAITSPGLAEPPVRRRFDAYDATWRLSVGVYSRGRDYAETARRNRRWAAIIRACLVRHPDLGAGAESLTWVGEEYRQVPQKNAARTLAGCAVAFDVKFTDVVLFPTGPGPVTEQVPTVQTPITSVTVR